MKKGKLIGKIFGIALVLVMIGPMLGGSLSTLNIASADDSNGVGEDPFNYQGQYIIDQAKLSGEENETLPYVQKYAQEQGISPALLMAIIKQESNFSPNAIGDSGLAIGYMQLHWDAAYDAGYRSARGGNTEEEKKAYAREDWPICGLDPFTNIKYGCGYLRICYNKHKDSSVYNDPLKNAISAYNLGWPHGPDKSNENSYVNPIVEAYKDYKTKYITYAKYGDIIGVYRGVKAFSNGPCTAKFEGIYEGQNCALPKNRNYQCVEYVKRFYKEAMGIDTHGWYGNANQYYGTAREKGLKAYPNGGSIAPQAGDILCFDDGGLGHVAIIMEVGDANIQIIEQNWHRNTAYDTLSWDKDNNTIPDRGISRSYQVQGWLRSPISAGLYYLRKHQNTNGSWQNNVGITSMAALAFLNAGYIARCDPAISKAIQYILNNCHDGSFGGTYETSAAVWALVATHNPDYNDEISDAKDWLVNAQYDEGEGIDSTNPYYGGWSYGSNPSWADLSNTQFALMALDAAGLHKSSTTWTKAIKYVSRCQNRPASNDQGWAHDDTRPSYNDGGFIYCPEWSFVGQTGSYGSITAGGVWSLRLCGVDVTDPRVQAGLKWLAENEDCSFDDNPGHPYDQGHCFLYYYYMTTAKSLTMCFLDDLGDVDWYAALSTKLADLQYDDGHWVNAPAAHGQEDIAELATDYALLALQLQQRPLANLWMSIILASNADLCVYDPQGRHACLGDITIPGATFEIDAEGRQIVNLKELEAGKYRIELTGTADGGYSLTIEGYRDEEQTSSETFEGTISEGEVQKSDTLVTSMVGALTIYVEEPEPLLVTGLLNVRLIAADPTVNQINVSSLDLSEIDETYKPEEVISKYAYLVDAMGTGNFTLEFTDIVGANTIKVYKIDPTLTPPNQWIELDYTTIVNTVMFTMGVGDPPIVFAGPANTLPVADAGPDQTVCVIPPATTAMVTLDGSSSHDADGDPLTYNWTWDGNTAHGVNPTVELPLGTTTITLVVNDGKVDSEPDTVDITVQIPATIDFDPDVLNLDTKGKYVTAYIELPPGYDVSQIDISSIRLNGTVPALGKPTEIGDYDDDGLPDLMVKFHRTAVQDALTVGEEIDVTITGEVDGITLEGSESIRVITAAAPHGRSEWTRVSTPTTEGWVLAPDSVIVDYAVADDGNVAYAIVYSDATGEFHLLKSTDGAATWTDITDAMEDVLDDNDYINYLPRVATDNAAADFVAVALDMWDDSDGADEVHVFISTDGGVTFMDTGEVEDGGVYFPDGSYVSDLAVSPEDDDVRDIAIGGTDWTNALLFRSTVTGGSAGAWEDTTAYDGWDDDGSFTSVLVTDIVFSPSWETDRTILVTTVAGYGPYDVYLQSGSWGTSPGWNEYSTLGIEAVPIIEDVDIPMWLGEFDARRIAGMTLPEDYNSKYTDERVLWVWVNHYDPYWGDPACEIMRVDDDAVHPVHCMGQVEDGEVWLTNISYQGTIAEGEAIAGVLGTGTYDPVHGSPEDLLTECCEGVQVYRNDGICNMDICCMRWEEACKPPTGTFAMAVSYVGEDKAYAVSLWGFSSPYDEDAWSVSFDDGDVWNQLSLVDTHIDYLSDVAVSPDCNKTMLVSVNEESGCECDSVWLHAENLPEAPEYSGKWLRTWCSQLEGHIGGGWERGLLRLAPEETTGDNVYLVDYGTGNVYWNNMETLACWDPIHSTELDFIVDVAAQDDDTIYALDYYGGVARFDDYEWYEPVDSKVGYGWTIAVRGDDILVGGCDGDVSYSDDGGETFTELEDVPVAADYNLVTVAFDSYFDANNTIYAALAGFEGSSPTTGGIYRWVIGESDEWEDLGAENYAYTGLVLNVPSGSKSKTKPDTGGVLYASYVSGDTTGVARCLTPAEDVCCDGTDWDYLTRGLTSELFKMTPQALKICGCLIADTNSRIFAIDSSEYYDMEKGLTGTVWSFED